MKLEQYTAKQKKILIACIVAYTAAYVCRTNLTPALSDIQDTFGVTAARVGLLPTLFCIPYALGQIFTGYLADRFRALTLMLTGLLGSALINILFAVAPSLEMLMVLWCLNGVFQSMIWTPIVRIFAVNYTGAVRDHALFMLSFTMIAGYLIAWALSGLLTSHVGWRVAFAISGLVTIAMAVPSCCALRSSGNTVFSETTEKEAKPAMMPMGQLFRTTDLLNVLLLCLFNGYVRDSIMNWAPKMLSDTQNIDLSSALAVILIIPIVNYLGITFGKLVFRKTGAHASKAMFCLVLLESLFSLILFLFFNVSTVVCAGLIALCSAMAYGLNPLITSLKPMEYEHTGRVALVAGLLDATIYAGSAFSGTFVGYLRDQIGWSAVFASWAVFSFFSAMVILPTLRKRSNLRK